MFHISAIMEAVTKHLKKRDRKLTEFYHNLAVPDNFHPVYNDHFKQVHASLFIKEQISTDFQITLPWIAGLLAVIGLVCLCVR